MLHFGYKPVIFNFVKHRLVKLNTGCMQIGRSDARSRDTKTACGTIQSRSIGVCARFVHDFPNDGFPLWGHKRISVDGTHWKYPIKITEIGPVLKSLPLKSKIKKNRERKASKALLVRLQLPSSRNKVTIVGAGMVGVSTAFSIASQNISNDVCLIDCSSDKLYGEVLDFQHGSAFLTNVNIRGSTDFECSTGSKVCIVTAGVRRWKGESQLNFINRNAKILRTVIPPLVKQSPDTILVIVTDPVDIMTYIAWKMSGLPPERVIGAGTSLDSSRFRFLLSKKIGVSAASCHGWIIGEHGATSVAVWSGVNIAGVRLIDLNPKIGTNQDPENWGTVHKKVIEGAHEVSKLKGNTCWSAGMAVSSITKALLSNVSHIDAVSILMKGYHGINEDVYLSLPVVLGRSGVTKVVVQKLSPAEKDALQASARYLKAVISKVDMK